MFMTTPLFQTLTNRRRFAMFTDLNVYPELMIDSSRR